MAHPLTESIKLAITSISVDLPSNFRSSVIDLFLFLANLCLHFLPCHAVKNESDDTEDYPEEE